MTDSALTGYSIRAASRSDVEVLVRHRLHMFREMRIPVDDAVDGGHFRGWFERALASGEYRGWLVVTDMNDIAAGGGLTVLACPPVPGDPTGALPFVFNVYTEPAHRRRGLARLVMTTMQNWCRESTYRRIGLAASEFGRPLYEAMGYRPPLQPYLFLRL